MIDPWQVYPFPRLSAVPLSAGGAAWDKPDLQHLMLVDLRVAQVHLKIRPGDIKGPPRGLIVGDSPGPTGKLPLFPWPSRSSGGRLAAFGGMQPADYLGRFHRINLFDAASTVAKSIAFERAERVRKLLRDDLAWRRSSRNDAEMQALASVAAEDRALSPPVEVAPLRVLLCGLRVAEAFGVPMGSGIAQLDEDHQAIAIPHPSGLNRQTNTQRVAEMMGIAVRWAAGYTVRWG